VVVDDGEPTVARVASIKFSYDERVEDGLYAARALEDFRSMVEHPMAAAQDAVRSEAVSPNR